uniref:C-type lectin domain-containing protein n=1 Tax=Amphilophus citrinellus TaxID=61819 RepID=A0A3Q0SQ59_AMPCI
MSVLSLLIEIIFLYQPHFVHRILQVSNFAVNTLSECMMSQKLCVVFPTKYFKLSIFVLITGLCFLPVCFPRIYEAVLNAKDWTSAKNYCRNKYTDLAIVHNDQDLAMVNNITKGFYNTWIGLQADTEAWRWSLEYQNYYGEGEAEFRMWAVNQPSGGPGLYKACVAMLQNGEWADQTCHVSYPFICYYQSNEKRRNIPFLITIDIHVDKSLAL